MTETCTIAQPTMPPVRKPYTTDLTDFQWELLRPLIPDAKPGGRPREVDTQGDCTLSHGLKRTCSR